MFTLLAIFLMFGVFLILSGILIGIAALLFWLFEKLRKRFGKNTEGTEEKSGSVSFVVNALICILFLLIGWGMLSYLGAIPGYMSMPMKTHYLNQVMAVTGADVQEEFRKTLDEESIPKGTFDAINESSKYQARLRDYMKGKDTLMFTSSGKDRAFSLKNGKLKSLWKAGRQMGLLVSEKGLDYFISCRFRGQTTVDHGGLQADGVTYYEGVQRVFDGFIPEYLAELLNKQKNGKITPREYANLLEARVWGQLAGWFPESDTAFILDVSEEPVLRVYNTADGTSRETQIPQEYTLIGFVNDHTAACISPDGNISMCDIDEGELDYTIFTAKAVNGSIWVDETAGDVYLSIIHENKAGSHTLYGIHWMGSEMTPVGDTLWHYDLEEDRNWQEADILLQKDIAYAVFPGNKLFSYVKYDQPWE